MEQKEGNRMAITLAITNSKGGVGKTTTCANLGAALAAAGKRVLLVDNDPQGDLTKVMRADPKSLKYTLANLMNAVLDDTEFELFAERAVVQREGVHYIPANSKLAAVSSRLVALQMSSRYRGGDSSGTPCELVMARVLTYFQDRYDYILIDCGHSMDLLTINALAAADQATILDIDREGGVAIASRRLALTAQRHFFDTIKGGRNIGDRLTCRVLAVGPKRCLVECGGRDMSLSQKDLTYTATPDLRTRYHPGQTLNCVLKEYDRREEQFWVSVKETVDNPFFGALRRHPIGSRRQAVISGKYGGGVFCTLSDETVCLCLYSTRHSDLDFHVGDTVILAIKQFDYDRCLIYGRILSKW